MKDYEMVDKIYNKYSRHFEGSFHSVLWQLLVNKAQASERKAFTAIVADDGKWQLSLACASGGHIPLSAWFVGLDGHGACETVAELLSADVFGITVNHARETVDMSMRGHVAS